MIRSQTAPRLQRTSLTSARGTACQCIPRSVPGRALNKVLHWTSRASIPCAPDSRAHQVRTD